MDKLLHRYKNYDTKDSVYLFTLRDYCEYLVNTFGGNFIIRHDMVRRSGYLMDFSESSEDLERFVLSNSIAATNNGSVIDTKDPFVTISKSIPIKGDGSTKVFRLSTREISSKSIKVHYIFESTDSYKTVTINDSNTIATFDTGSIDLINGTVTFTNAPVVGSTYVINFHEVLFSIYKRLFNNTLYVGLSEMEDFVEQSVSNKSLEANGLQTTFYLGKNIKSGTVSITFKESEEGDSIGPITDSNGKFSVTSDNVTTTYGTIDYSSGLLTMKTPPTTLSFSATFYRF